MKAILATIFAGTMVLFAIEAWAGDTHNVTDTQTLTNTNTANGGQGGAGGQGGNGGYVNHSGNSTNTNANTAVGTGVGIGGKQHQHQTQGQGQSSSNTNTTNGSVTNVDESQILVPASAPAVFAPALAAAPETCMGSASFGGSGSNGILGIGISGGTTWKSIECERRMYARMLTVLGQTEAALQLLANNTEVRQALAKAGVVRFAAEIKAEKDMIKVVEAPVAGTTTVRSIESQ